MRKVKVVPYEDEWIDKYHSEADQLMRSIGFLNPAIHHIGSTSVPGLPAKPIIDILIEVENVADLDRYKPVMEEMGYVCRGENGIPGRRYFDKGADDRTHHVHAFSKSSPGAVRHLAFRDYLISHPQVAGEYDVLKIQIAASCNNNIIQYCDEKDPFIKKHEQHAVEWYALNK